MALAAGLGSVATIGCGGGGGGGGGTGGSGGGGNSGTLSYTPCPPATRVGGFSVELKDGQGQAAYAQFTGGVRQSVNPAEVRVELAKEGVCRLTDDPTLVCAPACGNGQICAGQNQCIPEPLYQTAGNLTLTGLAPAPVTAAPLGNGGYYVDSSMVMFPAVGTAVSLSAPGGTFMPFTLRGQGVAPLQFAGTGLDIARNKALAVTWTAPSATGAARIFIRVDIAHHGGGRARVECDVPDNGAATIPATLINQLMDRGTAGFPSISLTRQTVDSATITAGCVDFLVASPVERPLTVEGVVSCNCTPGDPVSPCDATSTPCPMNRVCRANLTCAP